MKTNKNSLICPVCGRANCCTTKNKLLSPALYITQKPNHCKYCRSWIVNQFKYEFIIPMIFFLIILSDYFGTTANPIIFTLKVIATIIVYCISAYFSPLKEHIDNYNNENKFISEKVEDKKETVKSNNKLTCPVCGGENCCTLFSKIMSGRKSRTDISSNLECKYCRSWITNPPVTGVLYLGILGFIILNKSIRNIINIIIDVFYPSITYLSFFGFEISYMLLVIQVVIILVILNLYVIPLKEDKENYMNKNKRV